MGWLFQFKSQEEDRDELVRQVLALKRETAKLRQDLDRSQAVPPPSSPQAAVVESLGGQDESKGVRLQPLLPATPSPALGKQEVNRHLPWLALISHGSYIG